MSGSTDRAPAAIVVLISGGGTNLQAIIDEARAGRLPVVIRAVISNEPGAGGLARAMAAGIPCRTLDHRDFATRDDFDEALARLIDGFNPALVVLAGFMRVLGEAFVARFRGRIMNIHPSLLPRYKGLDTHQRALADGAVEHGATVHFVTGALDGGPIVIQRAVPVLPDDTPGTLAERVLEQEHQIYPQAIRWFAEGRLSVDGDRALLDGRPLPVGAGDT